MVAGGVDLLEAEGRLARVHLVRICALGAILLASALIVTLSVVAIGAGTVTLLAESMGTGPALIWTGIGAIVLCSIVTAVAWSALRAED